MYRCGVRWDLQQFTFDCGECGGYALERKDCPICSGECGSVWERDILAVRKIRFICVKPDVLTGDNFKSYQNAKSLYIFSLTTPRRQNGKEYAILKTLTVIKPAPMIISIDWRRKIRIENIKSKFLM